MYLYFPDPAATYHSHPALSKCQGDRHIHLGFLSLLISPVSLGPKVAVYSVKQSNVLVPISRFIFWSRPRLERPIHFYSDGCPLPCWSLMDGCQPRRKRRFDLQQRPCSLSILSVATLLATNTKLTSLVSVAWPF